MTPFPEDFKDFLRLLNSHGVEYLLVGGYALAFHGHIRATQDMDVWIDRTPGNALRVAAAITDFGFNPVSIPPELFLKEEQVIRMGVPPLRIEVITSVSGVSFMECRPEREIARIYDLEVPVISRAMLKKTRNPAAGSKTSRTWNRWRSNHLLSPVLANQSHLHKG